MRLICWQWIFHLVAKTSIWWERQMRKNRQKKGSEKCVCFSIDWLDWRFCSHLLCSLFLCKPNERRRRKKSIQLRTTTTPTLPRVDCYSNERQENQRKKERAQELTLISELGWSMKTISDSSPSSSTLTVFSPNSSSMHEKFNPNARTKTEREKAEKKKRTIVINDNDASCLNGKVRLSCFGIWIHTKMYIFGNTMSHFSQNARLECASIHLQGNRCDLFAINS